MKRPLNPSTTPIATLEGYGLDYRTINCLEKNLGSIYMDRLLNTKREELVAIDNLGETKLNLIIRSVKLWVESNELV